MKTIKKIMAWIIVISFVMFGIYGFCNTVFIRPIKEVFKDNPVTFINVAITVLVYAIFIGLFIGLVKIGLWAVDKIFE